MPAINKRSFNLNLFTKTDHIIDIIGVRRAGKTIILTPKEFAILEYLVRHKGQVVTRTQITEHVWDYNFDALSNVVDVFMATLRRKINTRFKNKLIYTIHGVGYRI